MTDGWTVTVNGQDIDIADATMGAYSQMTPLSQGVALVYLLIGFCASVLLIVALWKLFVKAGKPGWYALIPFLNIYQLYKLAWSKAAGVTLLILMGVTTGLFSWGVLGARFTTRADSIAGAMNTFIRLNSMIWVAYILILLISIINIICYVYLAKAFGRSGWFAVGLVFLTPIFFCIMAFGKSEYMGSHETRVLPKTDEQTAEGEIDTRGTDDDDDFET